MLETLQQAIARVQGLTAYATYKDKLTNTFGVVVECDAPRDTTGTDLIQTILLVDESCPERVALCIFGKDVGAMPRAQLGDVLELQNVIVQFWQDRPQLFAKMSKPHTFGFTLYRAAGGAMQPVQQFNVTRDSRHAPERLPQLQALRLQAQGHASGTGVWARLMACLLPLHHSWQMPCRSCMPTMAPAATTMYRAPGQSAQCMFVGTSCVGACATTVQRHVNGS